MIDDLPSDPKGGAAGVSYLSPAARRGLGRSPALTPEELGLIACSIRYGPFPPKPEYLPACHRLAEAGWLERGFVDDELTFGLSAAGVAALELGVPLGEAHEAMN